MIRRLTYHCFWNFYDYLGTYLIAGVVHTFAILSFIALAGQVIDGNPTLRGWMIAGLLAVFALLITVALAAGLLFFSELVAEGKPARFPDLKLGITTRFAAVAKAFVLVCVFGLLLTINIMFYFRISGKNYDNGLGAAAMVIGMSLVWTATCAMLLMLPLLSAAGSAVVPSTVKAIVRRMLVVFTLAPGTWAVVAVVSLVLFAAGLLTQVGLIFVLPAVACFSQTAHWLVTQYAENLVEAQATLPPGSSMKSCKRKARELGWEWEYRQPRRTFRELIKPWEH